MAELLAGLISFGWIFLAVGVCMSLQSGGDELDGGESGTEPDPKFLPTARAYFNDILRFVSRRRRDGDDSDRDAEDEFEDWLSETDALFDEEDDGEELFAPQDGEKEDEDAADEPLTEEPQGSANFSGAFFKNRNYPRDVYDDDGEERGGETSAAGSASGAARWRRHKESDGASSPAEDERASRAEEHDEEEHMARRRRDEGDFSTPSLDASEAEFDGFDEDGGDDFLDDDSLSLEIKIERMRDRAAGGDDSARLELAQLLVDYSGRLGKGELDKSEAALAEAQQALDACETLYGEERDEAECHIAMQRAVFYMRNDMKPPFELVTAALQRAREWYQSSGSEASRTLLARAWLLHGQRLLASGSSAAALSSLQKAREFFTGAVDNSDEFGEKEESDFPSIGFVMVAEAEAYHMIGETDKSVAKLREAAAVFDRFSSKRVFLAQKANVLSHLAITLREAGRESEASAALEEAIAAEERLYSYDPSKYFAGLSQLLRLQSELRFKEGDSATAFALLERAESTLLTSLIADVPLKRRVYAYVQLSQILRGRAGMHLLRRRMDFARRDALKALQYLSMATEKDEELNPGPGVTSLFAFIYDIATMEESWLEAQGLQEVVEGIVGRLTRRERRATDPMYAELLLHMHMVNASGKRFEEACAMTNRAVELLTSPFASEDEQELARRRLLLAKSLYQRGSYSFILKRRVKETLKDFRRIEEIYEESDLLSEDDESRPARDFYVEFLWRYACVLWQLKDASGARRAIAYACRLVMADLESGKWNRVTTLKKLAYVTTRMADMGGAGDLFLRLTRYWGKYVQKTRRQFLENGYDSDLERQSMRILSEFDETILSLTLSRAHFFTANEWREEYSRYIPRELRLLAEDRLAGAEPGMLAVLSRGDAGLPESTSLAELCEARERFISSRLTDAPGQLLLWYELHKCVRALERQVEAGVFTRVKTFVYALKRLCDLYTEADEPGLAAVELALASSVFGKQATRLDSEYAAAFGTTAAAGSAARSRVDAPVDSDDDLDGWDDFGIPEDFADEEEDDDPVELFWNGAFYVSHFKLIALHQLIFGKVLDYDFVASPYLEAKDENEATMWLTPRGDAGELAEPATEADEEEEEDADSDSDSDSAESPREAGRMKRADYETLDESTPDAALLEREFARCLFLGKKMKSGAPWQYMQYFFFIRGYYDWYVGRGHADEGAALVRRELGALEEETRGNLLLQGFSLMFYDLLGAASLDAPRNVELAREIYAMVLSRQSGAGQFTSMFIPETLFGTTHIRLAILACEEGDHETEAREFRLAAAEMMRGVNAERLNKDCFEEATKLLDRFFSSENSEDEQVARRMFRDYERSFDAARERLEEDARKLDEQATQTLTYAWITFMRAAGYYDERRKCYYVANRLYRKAETLLSLLTAGGKNLMPMEFYATRIAAASFFSRYGLADDSRRILEEVCQSCRALTRRADALELPLEVRSAIRKLTLQLRLALAEQRIFRGPDSPAEFLSGLAAAVEATPDYLLFQMFSQLRSEARSFRIRIAERFDFAPKTTANVLDGPEAQWAGLSFMARLFSAMTGGRGASETLRNVERVLRDIREQAGAMCYSSYLCRYYWADYALRLAVPAPSTELTGTQEPGQGGDNRRLLRDRRRYLNAGIRAAGRVWRRRYHRPTKNWGVSEELCGKLILVDSMKLEAFGLLERRRLGDVAIASKIIHAALEQCEEQFRAGLFVFRPIFAELLALKARALELQGRRDDALAVADRAVGIVERCEQRGVVNWLPALREGLVETLRRLRG